MYEPREDSFLLLDVVEEVVSEREPSDALDMGSGSGIIAQFLMDHCDVTAVDVSEEAVSRLRRTYEDLQVIHSDLFESVPQHRYDLITFNPPYLPGEYEEDNELLGGEGGIGVTCRFLSEVSRYLSESGRVLFVATSRGDVDAVEQYLDDEGFKWRVSGEEHMFFETLYIYDVYEYTE